MILRYLFVFHLALFFKDILVDIPSCPMQWLSPHGLTPRCCACVCGQSQVPFNLPLSFQWAPFSMQHTEMLIRATDLQCSGDMNPNGTRKTWQAGLYDEA